MAIDCALLESNKILKFDKQPKGSEALKKLLDIPADRRTDAVIDDVGSYINWLQNITTLIN